MAEESVISHREPDGTAPNWLEVEHPGREALEAVVLPYVVEEPESAWASAVLKLERKIGERERLNVGGPSARDQAEVETRWGAKWAGDVTRKFRGGGKGVACLWSDRRVFVEVAGIHRAKLFHVYHLIEHLKPASVLEVGCGAGANLALLANRFPEIAFSGIELTATGVDQCERLRQDVLPPELTALSPEPLLSRDAHKSIAFRQGDAARLPYADAAFSLVLTMQALEQMEQIRNAALSEIARVCVEGAIMVEPFRDFNQDGLRRRYTEAAGYFGASISDLESFGLSPSFVSFDLPSKLNLGVGVVLAAKGGAPRRPADRPR